MILVADFEATCWEKRKKDLNEIIEIGIVVCSDDCDILGMFSSTVRPFVNKRLSEQCIKLTKITQEEVDHSDYLPAVIDRLSFWFKDQFYLPVSEIRWGSWGASDITVLKRDCERHDLSYPFGDHINLESLFCKKENIKGIGATRAIESKGFTIEGREHRALDDALNLCKICKYIFRDS
jgi:inhibitor of KinA sporulation pathway (predicted exonuclease)